MGRTPSAQYSITVRVEAPHQPGWIGKITTAIGQVGGSISAIDLVEINRGKSLRDYSVECVSTAQAEEVARAMRGVAGIVVHEVTDDTLRRHQGGKMEIVSRVPLETRPDLSMAYTPGVARVCSAIQEDPIRSFDLTIRGNCVAVISDGSAVLGLGDVGALAAMPVMEGKAILFKKFGGVDAFPLCLDTRDSEAIIAFCKAVAPTFGGINLEDISAPRCFEIENRLKDEVDIPVMHDDQHGTAVVALAAFINALRVTGRRAENMKCVVSGAGAAGWASTRILQEYGLGRIVVCDSRGALHAGRDPGKNIAKEWIIEHTNPEGESGPLSQVIRGADFFLGLSAPGALTRKDVESMAKDPIIFAMANPDPEIDPEEVADLVGVMATGRSDYPNQVNNVLVFPGIFKGALAARARDITDEMKQAAARAIASMVSDEELAADYVIPSVFNLGVAERVAETVTRAARRSGTARFPGPMTPGNR